MSTHPATPRARVHRLSVCSPITGSARRALLCCAALALVAAAASCGGDGQKSNDAPSAAALSDEREAVFAPAWSTNSAPPPKAGGIREIGSIFDEMPAGFQVPEKPTPKVAGPVDSSASNWTIALRVFRGDDSAQEAGRALTAIRGEGALPDAYLQRRGPATVIAYGSYSGPTDPRAQSDMHRIQELVVQGSAPYAGSYLCPPYMAAKGGEIAQYDLRQATRLYGPKAMYTLQVGWYGREDLPHATEDDLRESRHAAEEAAQRLRQEGELAFFYHGPNRSMVTVGVFDTTDFDPYKRPGFESERLREAKRRHPLNLYNGAGYSYKAAGMFESKLLPSGLVAIPNR